MYDHVHQELFQQLSSSSSRYLQEAANTTANNDTVITNKDGGAVDVDEGDELNRGVQVFGIIMSNVFLFCLIFGLSATVEVKNLKKQLTNKFALCTGVCMQYMIMPVLGCLSVVIFTKVGGLPEAIGISLLVVTSSPGGSYSNWWCSTFNADLPLSVAMTTVSSLLSVVMLPFNLFLYTWLAYSVFGSSKSGNESSDVIKSVDFGAMFISLSIVLAAILFGLFAAYKYDTPLFHERANKLGTMSGICLILFSLFVSTGGSGSETSLMDLEWSFYIATMLPCLGGIVLANIAAKIAKLKKPEQMAIAIECCYQNTGIATSVAITMWANVDDRAQAVAVPLFYGIVEAGFIFIYCLICWKAGYTKAPPNENICVVITKSYEIDHHDHDQDNMIAVVAQQDDGSNDDAKGKEDGDVEQALKLATTTTTTNDPSLVVRDRSTTVGTVDLFVTPSKKLFGDEDDISNKSTNKKSISNEGHGEITTTADRQRIYTAETTLSSEISNSTNNTPRDDLTPFYTPDSDRIINNDKEDDDDDNNKKKNDDDDTQINNIIPVTAPVDTPMKNTTTTTLPSPL